MFIQDFFLRVMDQEISKSHSQRMFLEYTFGFSNTSMAIMCIQKTFNFVALSTVQVYACIWLLS